VQLVEILPAKTRKEGKEGQRRRITDARTSGQSRNGGVGPRRKGVWKGLRQLKNQEKGTFAKYQDQKEDKEIGKLDRRKSKNQ